VAFDIGANYGKYTKLLAENFVKVYAFEADPRNVEVLCSNAKNLVNVEIVPMAISNKTGVCEFLLSDYAEASSLKKDILTLPGNAWGVLVPIQVPCITIDGFCELRGIEVDFIKMDIEGAEDFVWEGAHKALSRGVDIVMEVHRTVDVAKLQKLFEDHGYKIEGWPGSGCIEAAVNAFWERHYYLRPR
jgi:FkbM family methyltransferase